MSILADNAILDMFQLILLMLYEFKLSHNTMKATKKYLLWQRHSWSQCCKRWLKKFYFGCKEPQWSGLGLGSPKIMNSKSILRAIEVNAVCSSKSVSNKLGISQFNVIGQLHDFGKRIWSCQIIPHIKKNIWINIQIVSSIFTYSSTTLNHH